MLKSSTWVVKLGGAMMHSAALARWLAACAAPRPVRCVVVLGGGHLADEIRALHARWGFEEARAHELAIAAMAPWPGPDFWHRYVARIDGSPTGCDGSSRRRGK